MAIRDCIQEFEASFMAYNSMMVDIPLVRIHYVMSLFDWVNSINHELKAFLDSIISDECKEVLCLDIKKLTNENYWLRGRMQNDMTAYSRKKLIEYNLEYADFETTAELWYEFKKAILLMVSLLRKVDKAFYNPAHLESLIQRMRARHNEAFVISKYEQKKEEHGDLSMQALKEIQAEVIADFVSTDMMRHEHEPSPDDLEKTKTEYMKSMLPWNYPYPKDFDKMLAKTMEYIVKKKEILIVNRYRVMKYYFDHYYDFAMTQAYALFETEMMLNLIHQDMVKLKPELSVYLPTSVIGSLEGTKYFSPYKLIATMLQNEWFKELRTDEKYGFNWAERFAEGLVRSEHGHFIADNWKENNWKIMGYVLGCLKMAGVINNKVSNDQIARKAAIMKKSRSFGKYIGKESQEQPYSEWIINNVDRYC